MSERYDIILADPPWQYKVWSRDAGAGRSAESHYPTMTLDAICALPVRELAAQDACLFLWVVWPSLFDAKKVIEAWGFEYKTLAWTWVKANKSGVGFFTGMGYYTRANTEPCLLATRGNIGRPENRGIRSLIYAPVREHSRKPDEQYQKIERLYPGKRYLELFARRKREGWASWGNEVVCDVKLEARS